MNDPIQGALDNLFSSDKHKKGKKPEKKKLSTKTSILIGTAVFVAAAGGLGGMAMYQISQLQQQEGPQSQTSGPGQDGGANTGTDTDRGLDIVQLSYLEQTETRSCAGHQASIPVSWKDPKPDIGFTNTMKSVVASLSDEASRDEIIAIVAKGMASSRLTNSETENGSGIYRTYDEPSISMNVARASKLQLKDLRSRGLSEYSDSITPTTVSSHDYLSASSMMLASFGGTGTGNLVSCIPTNHVDGDDAYSHAKSWLGSPASAKSGSDVIGPTLADNRESGPPSFGGIQLVRYSVRQSTGKALPENVRGIMIMPPTEDRRGAVALSLDKNGNPTMMGVSSGDGEIIIADERSGVVKSLKKDRFGGEVVFR